MNLTKEDLKSPHFAIGRIMGVCDSPNTPKQKVNRIRKILQDFERHNSEGSGSK